MCSVYRAVVLCSLLYGAETWPAYKIAASKSNTFMEAPTIAGANELENMNRKQSIEE